MAVSKAKKGEVLAELNEKFGKATAVYFSDYRGLSVTKLGELRKRLREQKVEYVVAKKTLMRIALKNNNLPDVPDDLMQGPVGAAVSYDDVISAVKVLHNFSKEAEQLQILGGMVEGRYVSQAEAKSLATLPSREQLLAKLLGSLNAPISGFHGVLHGVMSKFVRTVQAVHDKQAQA